MIRILPRGMNKSKMSILGRGSNHSKDTDTKIQGRRADTKMQDPVSGLV